MKLVLRLALALLLAGLVRLAFAGDGPGTTAVTAMSRVESTRAQAFGGGAVAVGNDPTLVLVNPAAAARADVVSVTAAGNRGEFGDVVGEAGGTVPWRGGALTAGLHYYDAGEGQMYGEDGTLWSGHLQQDVLATAGYARQLGPALATGATIKYLRSRLAEQPARTALAGDFGAQLRLNRTFKVGLVVLNAGSPIAYGGEGVALPTVIRGGVAAGWRFSSLTGGSAQDTLIVVGDLDWRAVEGSSGWRGGLEYQWRGLVALRAGGRAGTDGEPRGVAAGVGLRLGSYRLDYTTRFGGLAGLPQTASLTVDFGPHRPAPAPAPAAAFTAPAAPPPPPPALPDQPTTMVPPVVAPAPASATLLDGPPPADGMIDDLNRRLDELIDRGKKK